MKKLLRILFVMSAIAFVTTLTACADNKSAKTGGDDKTAKTPSIFKFTAADAGVTIDESKDVYKITINPSLLTYPTPVIPSTPPVAALAPADIFTVTFTDDNLQGFIIPTTVDKAEDLTTTHASDLQAAVIASFGSGAPNNVTHSFLAAVKPGFDATEINTDWSTLTSAGIPNIRNNSKVRVICRTTMTGINKDSFLAEAPDAANDLAIAKDTETECFFSLVSDGANDDEKKAAYKAWAEAAVELAKDDSTKNIQKMGFVGIVTGDDTASAITKAAGITEDADALGVKGFTADASAKLVKAYKISLPSLQKVEIVIAAAK